MPHRADSFLQALAGIRERLRDGVFRPGERIAATEVADLLGLSATPVREALSRISGEGLLEDRRGQGFFVSALTGLDIADLYRLSLAHLTLALDVQRLSAKGASPHGDPPPGVATDPVRDVERLFADWMMGAGGQSLWMSFRTVVIKLGPVRRVEPLLFEDLAAEASVLRGLSDLSAAPERRLALEVFHARRIELADQLAPLVNHRRADEEV
ncbi:GntR family transcriptional regulator [Phenylobacterium sp.]|uniref:GntR family transcriptional regulator n=1 Tax=Phenylobacterium sp. TaxID=1871053 RepID=UPI00356A5756